MALRAPTNQVAPWSFLLKIWILALTGLIVPKVVAERWPAHSWDREAARAHRESLQAREWKGGWQAFAGESFNGAWISCTSLPEARALDQRIDDGNLVTGRLTLFQDGLVWLPE